MAGRLLGHNVSHTGRENRDQPIEIPVAKDLEKDPATMRREDEITFYNREYPLESFAISESASAEWAGTVRDEVFPETTELYEKFQKDMEPAIEWVRHSGELEPTSEPTGEDVTAELRDKAYELGYGAVGFARFDRRFLYQVRRKDVRTDLSHAICLAVEQDYAATQTLPSVEAEEAQGEAYKRQAELAEKLVSYINSLGYSAQVSGPTWHFGPMIPMFVEAGLGQLGVNGQLLLPQFGSRARLQIIITNAKVAYDKPVDYGIHKFCEICQVCSMRCPGRAIQGQRLWFRGVEKAKLIYKRCRPVMARYSGCGVCMKVCPVQKYGLKNTMDHYIETGEILGKGTANLEGFELPDKGYFRPGKLPVFGGAFFEMPVGRTEDLIMEEYKEGLAEATTREERERVWQEYRERVEHSLRRRSSIVDMGMDLAE